MEAVAAMVYNGRTLVKLIFRDRARSNRPGNLEVEAVDEVWLGIPLKVSISVLTVNVPNQVAHLTL